MPETTKQPRRKVRHGVVGGGPGSNIGETHRYAARFDGRYVLVTGVFAADAGRSRDFAATLDIAPDRRYGTWQEMAKQEAQREDGLEVVSILTPNNSHYPRISGSPVPRSTRAGSFPHLISRPLNCIQVLRHAKTT